MNADIMAVLIVEGVGMLALAGGLGLTWRRNGREQRNRDIKNAENAATRDATVTSNQQAILDRLNDPQTGMQAMNQTVNEMITHCAERSGVLVQRVATTERDIKELKSKKK